MHIYLCILYDCFGRDEQFQQRPYSLFTEQEYANLYSRVWSFSIWLKLAGKYHTHHSEFRKKERRTRTKQLFKGCDPEADFCSLVIGQNLSYMFNLESPDFSQFYWFTRSTHKTQHIVVFWPRLTAKQGYKEKPSKGKGTWGKVQRKPAACFQEYFPSWIT